MMGESADKLADTGGEASKETEPESRVVVEKLLDDIIGDVVMEESEEGEAEGD